MAAASSRHVGPRQVAVRSWGGSKGHLISHNVVSLAYVNAATRYTGAYEHDFHDTGVELWALSNGGLFLRHPVHRLWDDFDVSDST